MLVDYRTEKINRIIQNNGGDNVPVLIKKCYGRTYRKIILHYSHLLNREHLFFS